MTTELSESDAARFRAYERKRHDALAPTYDSFFTPVTRRAHAPLLDAAQLRAGARLLDVATGGGALAADAQARGATAVGVDLSDAMVGVAASHHPGIDFRQADVEQLPFPDEIFDAVVSNFGVGHFPYPERAVAECTRVLRPGGRLAFSWWEDSSKMRILGLFREASADVGAKPSPDVPDGYSPLRFADTAAFRELLEGAGLKGVTVQDHDAAHRIPDIETLWRGGLGSFAVAASAIAHQDQPTQEKIRAALERRAQEYMTADGLVLPVAFKIAAGEKER